MGNSTTKHHLSKVLKRALSFVFLWLLCSTVKAQIPSASFSADSTSGCAPLTVHFTNTSLQATSYFWDFGNGNHSTLPNPQTVYLSSGSHTVTLIAYNSASGQSDTLTIVNYITTVALPTANFTADVTSGCSPLTVTFTNSSINATSYVWDFGDGYSSTQTNPTHTFASSGLFTVKLVAYTAYGCSNVLTKPSYIQVLAKPNATITATPSTTCNANEVIQFNCPTTGIASYVWNFGHPASGASNTSTLPNPTHVYGMQGTFNVSLIVTGTNGCIDTVTMPSFVTIGNALVPTFTWNDSAGCAPLTVVFTAPSISNATSYQWTFGDPGSGSSNTSTQQNPSHVYNSSGNYSVSLFVTTSTGCNGGTTLTNIITIDQLPNAAFNATPTSGCAPAAIHFNNNSTGGVTYSWDFGDGTSSTLTSPTHTYTTPGTYTVTLNAYSVNGCQDTYTRSNYITVNGSIADFSFSPQKGCAPLNVAFNSGASSNAVAWKWNFGDPGSGAANTSTLQNPSHTYSTLGTYSITLITTSATGCKDTIVQGQVLVAPSSVNYVLPDTIKGCQPLPVSFSNPLAGSSLWHWDFGVPFLTNDTSNASNPSYTFDSVGIYTVSLNAFMYGNNGLGCSQAFNPVAIVQVFPLILSPITYIQATPCAPYLIHFNDTTRDVVSWAWNFGDGSPIDTNQTPSHVYAQPGTYHVTLSIVTIMGCMTSLGTNITLGKTNPIVASSHGTCHDTPINFSLSSPGFTNILWNFGDGVGTSTSANPTYTYNQPGTFVVTLTTKGNDNCNYTFRDTIVTENPQPSFVINGPASNCGTFTAHFINTSTGATSYFWDWDDPTSSNPSSTAVNPSRKFSTMRSYNITLTASTQYCSRSITVPHAINVYRALPNFSFTQNQLCFPMQVQFTDLTGPAPAMQWGWNFYDGTTDSTSNPIHTFNAPPSVDSISLWVKDTNGCVGSKKIPGIKYKQARFSLSASSGCSPLTICFTDSSDTTVISRQWQFGDGVTSTLTNPCHTYAVDGIYSVTLITTFSSGCKDTMIMNNAITVSSPVADFVSPVVAFCAPAVATFNNLSVGATTYLWDFGDGSTSVAANPTHVYNLPGDYTITLIAYFGTCTDTMVKVNYLHVPGTNAYFNLVSLQSCQGNNVQFTDSSLGANFWLWNFGDGDSSTLQNPLHFYADTGNFIVSLITYDSLGCTSHFIFSNPISVIASPVANATTTDTLGCNPYTAAFSHTSVNATSIKWLFGDATTSTLANPSHTYNNAGVYQPKLVAYNSFGCTDTIALPPINVHQVPDARFTTTPSIGCTPLNVSFNNTSLLLSNPSYSWDFGNTQTSTLASPQSTYTGAGTFTVTLIVTNDGMCTDTISHSINSILSPTAIASTNDTLGCSPYTSTFSNTSIGATSYLWNFGDNTTSTQASPSHTYSNAGVYSVTLVVTNAAGCKDTLILPKTVRVMQTPTASFTSSVNSGCTSLAVSFTNTSIDTINAGYSWNLGNALTASTLNAFTVYTDSLLYIVSLITTNSNGCADTATKTVNVHLTPTAIAFTNDTVGCNPHASVFANQSVYATSYDWNFGDNSAHSTAFQPTHSYAASGNYIVTMIATNTFGCKDTIVFPYAVQVNQTPNATFSSSTTSGCSPLSVSFTSTSSQLSNAAYNWSFGNTLTSTAQNPSTVYPDSGSFIATLIVTNDNGCADTATKAITVLLTPTAQASTADTVGCSPFTSTFVNASTGATSYLWNFGDNTTSTQANPSHTYQNGGSYTVKLIAYNANGCSDTTVFNYPIHVLQSPNASFTSSVNSGCSPLAVSFTNTSIDTSNATYAWNFGNTLTTSTWNASTIYTDSSVFNTSLIVTNANGCSDTATKNITVHLAPTAIASTTDTIGCSPFTATFANNSVYATSYDWNFGDNTAHSTVATPSHTYQNAGSYTVTLIVSNAFGCKDTIVLPYSIQVNQTPTAAFTPSVNSGCTTLGVTFTSTSTNLINETYNWNFGNAITSTLSNPSVAYTDSGSFNVSLIVTNANGCSDTANHVINVHLTPTAVASTADTVGCSPFTVAFANNSIYATSYDWNFGDNTAHSTAATPSHVYQNTGAYTVTLIVANAFGCKDTIVLPYAIQVNQTPTAAFTSSVSAGCTPLSVNFTTTSANLINETYSWNFGNTVTSILSNPSVTYTDSGNFNVSLIVTNANGCSDTANHIINVHLTPTAIAATTDTVGCTPFTTVFSNTSNYTTTYNWNFGDNTTHSTVAAPSHIYQVAGTYTVTLIVGNAFGCKDTLVLPYSIHVNQTPTAVFTPSSTLGCTPLTVNFSNGSAQLVTPNYNWNFGNGVHSTLNNPSVTYADSGSFHVTLITSNNNGCKDTATANIHVNISPTASGFTNDTTGCSPYTASFTSNTINATNIVWHFGNGQTATGNNVQYTYANAGLYQPFIVATNTYGCSDTFYLAKKVRVRQTPTAAFSVNQTAACSGFNYGFSNLSSDTINPVYVWTIGGFSTNSSNFSIPLLSPGFYTVSLMVTNNNGCADTLVKPNYIQVFDTLPPPQDPIYSVSVISNSEVKIKWANSSVLDLGAYKLWRLDPASSNYVNVYTDNNPVNSSMNPESEYTEQGLNTLVNTYTYKLQTLDRCAKTLPVNVLHPHTTVNISTQKNGSNIDVSWTPYGGCPVATYEISRVEVSNGSSALIAVVPGTQLFYKDTTLMCPVEYSYRVQATDLCGLPYESLSDTASTTPGYMLEDQEAIIVRSTVVNNEFVLTEWSEPQLHPERVIQYNIYRSTDTTGTQYSFLTSVGAGITSYEDYNVDVNGQNYYYKLEAVSDCNLSGKQSENSSSILLQSKWEYAASKLWWTRYDKWDTGVERYEVEKYNWITRQWEKVKTVPGNATQTEVDE